MSKIRSNPFSVTREKEQGEWGGAEGAERAKGAEGAKEEIYSLLFIARVFIAHYLFLILNS